MLADQDQRPVGYLEELKRQADAALAQQTQDIGVLQRNALLTDSACQTTSRYFGTLARQLERPAAGFEGGRRFDGGPRSASSASPISPCSTRA